MLAMMCTCHITNGAEIILFHSVPPINKISLITACTPTPADSSISIIKLWICLKIIFTIGKLITVFLLRFTCYNHVISFYLSFWRYPCRSQVLLVWSKRVASHDVAFFKGLVHSLIGSFSGDYGESNLSRKRRAADVEPQNIEEDL